MSSTSRVTVANSESEDALAAARVAGAAKHVLVIVAHFNLSFHHHLLDSAWYVLALDGAYSDVRRSYHDDAGRRSEISLP